MRPKKSLGQNFLRDPKILKKIVDFAQIKNSDLVVEVGPGEGTLTELLLRSANRVIAIEKDAILAKMLQEKFQREISEGNLSVVVGDILEIENLLEIAKLKIGNYILVGNIPYYITGAIFKKFLESEHPPQSITFVVQKEVADRIIARDGKESILSISIKAFGEPEYGGVIKAGSFSPAPKVDSAIISVRNISKIRFNSTPPPNPLPLGEGAGRGAIVLNSKKIEGRFFEIVKTGFAHKRKFLFNNLSRMFLDTQKLKESFAKCGLAEKVRAEDLKVGDWLSLTKELS